MYDDWVVEIPEATLKVIEQAMYKRMEKERYMAYINVPDEQVFVKPDPAYSYVARYMPDGSSYKRPTDAEVEALMMYRDAYKELVRKSNEDIVEVNLKLSEMTAMRNNISAEYNGLKEIYRDKAHRCKQVEIDYKNKCADGAKQEAKIIRLEKDKADLKKELVKAGKEIKRLNELVSKMPVSRYDI